VSDVLLEVKNLKTVYTSDFETVHAVNGISFTLNKGETLGIVGETGSGKTTTALSILRLLPSISGKILDGSILYEGKNLLEATPAEMRTIRGGKISMIFQDPMTALNPLETVEKQIEEALLLHSEDRSKKAIAARVDEVLRLVGIVPERKKEYPHQFSGGMKQRVVIAIALSCAPELIIADEPTTALDVTIQAQVLAMIADLRKKLGTAMIMITHDLGIVAKTCDKVAVMYAGEFIETGTLEDIFTGDKHHPYTEGLFGSIPTMNDSISRLSPIPGLMPDPSNLPKGCAFSPRCPYCTDLCRQLHPEDVIEGTHTIKCFRFSDEHAAKFGGEEK